MASSSEMAVLGSGSCSSPAMLPRHAGGKAAMSPKYRDACAGSAGTPRKPSRHGWICGEKVGHGSYGCVYKALDKETGLIFAVKKAAFQERSEEDRRYNAKLLDELRICKDLRHPHIVSCLGHEYVDGLLSIFLEYVPGGSLASVLYEFGAIEGPLLRKTSRGMLEGLNYLHSCTPPIVHRDIKGANVLVGLNFCVKLADFGCSKRSTQTISFTTVGSIPWMAPEVVQQNDGYGRKADVWSLGCTIIEAGTAEKPWGKDAFDNVMFALKRIAMSDDTPTVPEWLEPECREFIGCCLQRAPERRLQAKELLEHEFVSNVPG